MNHRLDSGSCSLPDRQLRKWDETIGSVVKGSLPDRQLRNSEIGATAEAYEFTAG